MLYTPYLHGNRGNSTTAKRIYNGLLRKGYKVAIFSYEEDKWDEEAKVQTEKADLIHIIHFYRFAKWQKQSGYELKNPYILTSGGTDVNENLFNKRDRLEMQHLLENANAITVFTDDAKQKLIAAYESIQLKIEVINQSVWFPKKGISHQKNILINGNPTILLPSGLRKVKDIFYLMDEIISLKSIYERLQLVIVGMALEADVYKVLQQYMLEYDWITFFENIPIEGMPSFYEWADIVLNTSISEGQSSAILEAMHFGCLVFARQNPGNASIVDDGKNGFLFQDGSEFLEKFNAVQHDHELKHKLITQAKQYVQQYHSFEEEINSYITVYSNCLEDRKGFVKEKE